MTSSAAELRLADEPHHDGSPIYTDPGPRSLGDSVSVRLRVPAASGADRVRVRSTPDAEPLMTEASITSRNDGVTWWSADLPLHNPSTTYRFLLEGGSIGYGWLNQAGLSRRDVGDSCDFRIHIGTPPPTWLAHTVGYQIFLDRFASSDHARRSEAPDWAIPADWNTPLATDADIGTRQWYRGDLAGIEQHLDHLSRVGVNLIYLTPFFPARSSHRYDASSFDHVDPLLGGDEALVSLIDAAHRRGIRVIGDITLNHTGDHHDWFSAALRDPASDERGFYMFGVSSDDYVSWHDVPSLPKLDHRSTELAARLYDGDRSVVAKYSDAPFGLDGWRVDCANTTGRHADIDLTRAVAARTRATLDARCIPDGSDRWLIAEHCFDAASDLEGDGWQGVMAYQWFSRPLWSWLQGDQAYSLMSQIELPRLSGRDVVRSMRELGGGVSWEARNASMTMLDSHDSARFRTAVGGDVDRHLVGVAALMTMPGVPTLFAGSEVGVEGDTMDTCRVPFPWDESDWDQGLFEAVTQLTRLRIEHRVLQHGAFRWVEAGDDTMTFVRELDDASIIVHLRRADAGPISIDRFALTGARQAPPADAVPVSLFGPTPAWSRAADQNRPQLRYSGGPGASVTLLDVSTQ